MRWKARKYFLELGCIDRAAVLLSLATLTLAVSFELQLTGAYRPQGGARDGEVRYIKIG